MFLFPTVTQSEQERSCIALLRLQRRSGQFLWVHAVMQLKDNLENSQRPVIVCTNQVLRYVIKNLIELNCRFDKISNYEYSLGTVN